MFNLEFTFIKDDIPIDDDHDDVVGFINEAFVDEDIGTIAHVKGISNFNLCTYDMPFKYHTFN